MSDCFACGIAEKMIPRYAGGGCTDAEKRFLEKHCAECIECSVRLIHEKNKQETLEYSLFDRDYTDTGVHVHDAGQKEMPAKTVQNKGRPFSKIKGEVLIEEAWMPGP